jgi:autotransporter-associated beta strand protein
MMAVLCFGAVLPATATDYHFGSISQNFTIPSTDCARDLSADGNIDEANGSLSIYWRGASSDSSYLHFDLSSLQSGTGLGGPVSLNCVVNATWGGSVTGSQISTANGAWTAATGTAAPGFTAISGATNASGNYNHGATASWNIPAATFQSYIGNPSFNGLVLSGDSNSNAHFEPSATLTGTLLVGEIRVTGGTDWSAASWDDPAKTLRITGSNTVTGGNVSLNSGTTLSLQDQATLGGGAFSGVIANEGTLAVASSSNQSLSGTVSGSGAISKSGSGTLTLSSANTYSGQTLINSGTLVAASSTALGQGGHNGATMTFIGDGGTLALQGGISLDEHFHIWGSGAGGQGALRSISGNNALTNNPVAGCGYALRSNTTVAVDADTLTVSGFYEHEGSWGLIKTGAGKLVLQAVQTYTGGTTVNGGVLEVEGSSGSGRLNGLLTVSQGGSVVVTGDGSGLGYNGQISQVNLNGGSLVSAGMQHIWNIPGGIHLTGGTLSSNSGVSSVSAPQLEWGNTTITSHASTATSTINGRIHIRRDSTSMLRADVEDGSAATDLDITAALTESAPNCGLVKSGSGTLKLSGAVNLTGCITVRAGKLDLSSASLGSGFRINLLTGATMVPPSAGLPADAMVYLDGNKLKPGSWGPIGSIAAGTAQFESAAIVGTTAVQVPDTGISNQERWKQLEYGIFSHYTFAMGSDINDAANGFNADAYADAVLASGAQYVVWTAWHSNTFPLFPSQTMAKYGVGHLCSERDAVGAMIDAVKARGLRVFLYTHPYQPITGSQHNNFINDLYAELLDRHGSKLDGLWIDENQIYSDQDSLVDYKRLITTIKERNPDLVTMQNGGQNYTVDMGAPETINNWNFGYSEPVYNFANPGYGPGADDMFRTTVLQAAANYKGGGIHWSIDGVYGTVGGLAESGRVNTVGRYLNPIRESVIETKPSDSFPPPYKDGNYISYSQVDWVATSNMDDSKEFIHVLKPQSGNTIDLPAPADGKRFSAATLVCSLAADDGSVQSAVNLPMTMVQTTRGLRLTLPGGVSWSNIDTVIRLDVASKGGSGMVNNTSNAITYNGSSWQYLKNRNLGEFNDDVHTATANGDSFTFTFSGTDVEYIATREANRGPVAIYIDDVLQTTVDLSALPHSGSRQSVFKKSGLARGIHTLRCVKMGGTYMDADAFRVSDLVNDSDPEMATAYQTKLGASANYGGPSNWWQPGYNGANWITPATSYYAANEPLVDPLNNEPNSDWFETTFVGTEVEIALSCAFSWAYFYVKVDGVFHSNVQVQQGRVDTLSITGLTPGTHTVRCITWRATTDPAQPGLNGITVTRPDLWNSASGRGFGELGDDVHYTDINPGRFVWNFTGSGVEVITTRDSDARMGHFSVAGEGYHIGGRRNNFSLARLTGTSVFDVPCLPPGGNYQVAIQHTANMSGMNFSFARLAIDAIRVYKAESMASDPLYWGSSGNGGSGTWDSGSTANWYDGGQATPWYDFGGTNYTAVFGGSGGTVNVSSGLKANRVSFTANGYTLQGSELTLSGTNPTIQTSSGVTTTLATAPLAANGFIKSGAGTLNVPSLAGNLTLAAGTIQLTGGHNNFWNVPNTVVGAGAKLSNNTHSHIRTLHLQGGELATTGVDPTWGSWMLDNDVTVSGAATSVISAPRVAIANATGVSRAFDVADGSTLNVTGSMDDAYTTTANGLTKNGLGTMILGGVNTYTGSTTVNAGKLIITGSVANTSTVTIAAGAEPEISGTLAASAQIINHGTLVLTGSPQMSAAGGITNYGTIINYSKTYSLPGNLNNQGTVLSVPAAPVGLVATPAQGSVSLTWNAVSGATSYTVKQSAFSSGPFTSVATASTNSQVIVGLNNGSTYHFRVSASNAVGEGADSASVSATPGALPAPWLGTDIGAVAIAGSESFANGVFTIIGSGTGVYASSDQFHMVYQNSSGDCDISVRVNSLTTPSVSAKAGVMIRESFAANSRCAGLYVTPSAGVQFIWRTTTGNMVSIATVSGLTAPYWVRLQRVGNSFRAFRSADGTNWTQFGGNKTISMSSNAYIGQAVTSGTNSATCTGVISNVSVTP